MISGFDRARRTQTTIHGWTKQPSKLTDILGWDLNRKVSLAIKMAIKIFLQKTAEQQFPFPLAVFDIFYLTSSINRGQNEMTQSKIDCNTVHCCKTDCKYGRILLMITMFCVNEFLGRVSSTAAWESFHFVRYSLLDRLEKSFTWILYHFFLNINNQKESNTQVSIAPIRIFLH